MIAIHSNENSKLIEIFFQTSTVFLTYLHATIWIFFQSAVFTTLFFQVPINGLKTNYLFYCVNLENIATKNHSSDIIVIGDLNFSNPNWSNMSSRNDYEAAALKKLKSQI